MPSFAYPKRRRLIYALAVASSLLALVAATATSHSNAPVSSAAVELDESALQPFADVSAKIGPPAVSKGELAERPFYSAILDRDLPFMIYLPPNREEGKRYPTLYFLHGLAADYRQAVGLGLVVDAEQMMAEGTIPPMVIVLPNGENGYWMNHRPDGPRWRDYLINELIPYVEATEPVETHRQLRAIGGISAGGHAAMQLAWNNPELFGIVGAHSPGLRTQADAFSFFGVGEDYNQRDPITLAQRIANPNQQLWLDTGDGDPWRQRAEQLHNLLVARGVQHVWQHSPGGHDGIYWSGHMAEYMKFYGQSFAKQLTASAS
jgi:enterochelin esterase-like enzyme